MLIQKNICESIIGTLLNINGKTNNGLNARKDLEAMEVWEEIKPKFDKNARLCLPTALFTLTKVEKITFCKRLFD